MTSPLGFPGLTDVVTVDEHPLVHRHRASLDGTPVLVEVLTDDAAADRAFVDDHPGLLSPIEIGETSGRCAVMWPADETLAERLASHGPLPWHRAIELVAAVADAVDHAHQRGHHHGAIDPTVIQLEGGRRPVLDGFGLAEIRRRAAAMVPEAGFAADPLFTAPELGTTGGATVAGDVYSLGAVLSACIIGGIPAKNVGLLTVDAPDAVAAVVGTATAPVVGDRYGSAAELAVAVRAARDRALSGDDELDSHEPAAASTNGSNGSAGDDAVDDTADAVEPVASAIVIPPLDDTDRWYATDQHADWTESLDAVVTDVSGVPLDDDGSELLPGLDDVDARMVFTLAEVERSTARRGAPATEASDRPESGLGGGAGGTVTVADAEAAVIDAVTPVEAPPAAPTASGPPVLVVETGRIELDEPVEGDILVTGGQLVVRAEIRGSLQVDGGRAVVFAPVTGDVTNGGGMVSVEAKVQGRIRGQREFTTVRPGSQA